MELERKEIADNSMNAVRLDLKPKELLNFSEELMDYDKFDDYIKPDSLREDEDNVEHDTNEPIF